MQAQLVLAGDLGFILPEVAQAINELADQAGRKIQGLIRRYGRES